MDQKKVSEISEVCYGGGVGEACDFNREVSTILVLPAWKG